MRAGDLRDSIIEAVGDRVPPERVAALLPEIFMATQLKLVEDRWAGQPLEVAPMIRDNFVRPLFGTLDLDGHRHYTEGIIGMPRKWAKTTSIAGLALNCLFMEPVEGQLIATVAYDEGMAKKSLGFGKQMVERNPLLNKMCGGRTYSDRIYVPELGATWRVFPHTADDIEGEGARVAIFEEPHTYRTSDAIDAVRGGMGAREEPLLLGVTTAGPRRQGVLWDWIHGPIDPETKLREGGILRDPRGLLFWFGADDDEDIEDRAVWRKYNAPWITMEYLEDQFRRMPRGRFERYHLNRWTRRGNARPAIPSDVWMSPKNCRPPVFEAGAGVATIGVDAADKKDRTAFASCQVDADGDFNLRCNIRHADRDRGFLDYLAFEEDLRNEATEIEADRMVFDRRQMGRTMTELYDAGFPVEEFNQDPARMCPASQFLLELAQQGRLRHGGDAELAKHIANAGEYPRPPAGWRFAKRDLSDPECFIDGAIAAAMACYVADAERREGSGGFIAMGTG